MTKQSSSEPKLLRSRSCLDASTSADAMIATLTSDGKVTIPAEIRDALAMKAGDRMVFALLPGGTVVMRVKNQSIMSAAGCLYEENRVAALEVQTATPASIHRTVHLPPTQR